MMIKDWFLNKNFTDGEKTLINSAKLEVVKETEKAFQLKAESDYGTKTFWCPKSCVVTGNEKKEVISKENMKEMVENGSKIRMSANGNVILVDANKVRQFKMMGFKLA